MTSEQPESAVEVIQADREAAMSLCGAEPVQSWYRIREGLADHTPFVQAFARHRLATQPAEAQGVGEVLKAVERVQRQVGEWDSLQGHEPRDRFAAYGENLRHEAMSLAVAASALAADPTPQRADAEDVERVRNTMKLAHHFWLIAAKEALQGDLGHLRRHVALSEGRSAEDVAEEMSAALAMPRASRQAGRTEREGVARYREALEFYADEARWRPSVNMVTPAMDDKGHRARVALAWREARR